MQILDRSLAAAMCVVLCASTVPQPALAASPAPNPAFDRSSSRPSAISGDERILHALNRFTFGPRPGDVAAVRAMGLDEWFAHQLHPGSIDQTVLNARLAEYPAMQLSPQELLLRLPTNNIIRQVVEGRAKAPKDGILASIYNDAVDREKARRADEKAKEKAQEEAARRQEAGDMSAAPDKNSAMAGQEISGSAMMAAPAASGSMMMAAPAAPEKPKVQIDQAQIASVLALTPPDRVKALADMREPEFDAFTRALKPQQRAELLNGMTPGMKEVIAALENPARVVDDELLSVRLTHDIYSQAQLQEVMTDFWLNHFNVYLRKNQETPYYLVSYERDTIRPNSLGKFEDLLEAVAHSPAMMLYLDNSSSIGPDSAAVEKATQSAMKRHDKKYKPQGLNENYARELMELHTLSVNGGYTQADVIQAARILTGWTVDQPGRGGSFKFDPNRHEPGTDKVMGKKFKDKGEQQGRDFLHFLATRPQTAKFISRKLAIRFVSDDPPQSLVDRMAKSYMKSDGDIATVLDTMYHSPEFWSQDAYRAKVKTPIEFVVSAARASDANITSMQPLVTALRNMGMPLYGCIPPTGYKWDASDWVSTGALVNRMNFALALASNRLDGITTQWAAATAAQDTAETPKPESEEARLESEIITGSVSDATRSAVLHQFEVQSSAQVQVQPDLAGRMNNPPRGGGKQLVAAPRLLRPQPNKQVALPPVEKQDQLLAGLLLGSPEFQRR